MKKNNLRRDMIVLWISVSGLVCAALNLGVRKHMLGSDDQ